MQLLPAFASELAGFEWIGREAGRFARGEYLPAKSTIPWYAESWWTDSEADFTHFVHASTEDPSKLSYTPSERFGRDDRQLRTKPGKYLRKYFGDVLTENQITQFARKWAAMNEQVPLNIAETADLIEWVYDNGPNSCMSGMRCVRNYAGHGLAVAYIVGSKDADPTGRAVCWPEKRIYARIYGDDSRLASALARAGYRREGTALRGVAPGEVWGDVPRAPSFVGARLHYEENPDGAGFVAPWLDFSNTGVKQIRTPEGDDVLQVSKYGGIECQSQNGIVGGMFCDRCQEYGDDEDSSCVGDERWCSSCYENDGMYCENCSESAESEGAVEVHPDPNGSTRYETWWCSYCAEQDATECDECEKHFSEGTNEYGDKTLCNSCAEDVVTFCEHCEIDVLIDDGLVQVFPEGESRNGYQNTWCKSCAESDAEECTNCDNWFIPEGDGDDRCAECGPKDEDEE